MHGHEQEVGITLDHPRGQVVAVDPQLAVTEPLAVAAEVAQHGSPTVGREPGGARDDVGPEDALATGPVGDRCSSPSGCPTA